MHKFKLYGTSMHGADKIMFTWQIISQKLIIKNWIPFVVTYVLHRNNNFLRSLVLKIKGQKIVRINQKKKPIALSLHRTPKQLC